MATAAGTSSSGTFAPPQLWDFPPFFTLQVVDDTRAKQLDAWRDLVVAWAKANRANKLTLSDFPYWHNKKLKRKLTAEGINAVAEHVIQSGYGEWEDSAKKRLVVFWISPAEWAAKIYDFASEHGMVGSSVYTVYELHSGDDTSGAEFHGMDETAMIRALQHLERQGKAELFKASSPEDTGVKFFNASA